jgi:hypothetical protein
MQITGRLGNNLFQIAVAYSLAKKYTTDFFMVYNDYNKYEQEWITYFNDIKFVPRQIIPMLKQQFSEKRGGINCFQYHHVLEDLIDDNIFLDGYFQTEQYFKQNLPELRSLFLKKEIMDNNGYFIHVRRGDYVNHPVYTIDWSKYFRKAIQHFPEGSQFYIVSDDIKYCKEIDLFNSLKVEFVDLDTLDTLHFMAGCKGAICANSSFSWWGAYLCKREIVTMPKQWINNGMDTSQLYFEGAIVIDF